MNTNHKQKSFDKPLKKINNSIFIVSLSIIAVVIGIQFGNILYKLDFSIIDSVDTENFRNLINLSLPIVKSVYNSGKSSVSFSGEVKELFTRIFDFDLDSPTTILNAQSPLFMNYYRIQQLRMLSMADTTQTGQAAGLPDTDTINNNTQAGNGSIPNNGNMENNIGNNENTGDNINVGNNGNEKDTGTVNALGGKNAGQISGRNENGIENNSSSGGGNNGSSDNSSAGNSGNSTGNSGNGGSIIGNSGGQLASPVDGSPESSMSFGTDYGFNQNSGITGQNNNSSVQNNLDINQQQAGNQPGNQGNQPGNQGNQPISSISYEIEDEKEGDERDTVELDKIQIKNFTKHKIDIAKLLKEPLDINFSKKGPKVLIYHTHTTESYVLKEADLGKSGVPSFNTNPKYSVVRVGEELARNLEKYGIDTLHNGTVHDKVRDAAYGVSINTLQSYKKSYPSIQVYIDIHRDAVEEEKPKLRMTKEINGKNCAQIMFVVGADGMLPHPEWEENLKFVLKLQQKLNEKYPGLARPVWIVGKRYNQQISKQAILIEVGGDGNLLSECIESTKYLAEVLNDVMMDK